MTAGRLASLQPCAARHLDEYTNPASDYAFCTYDRHGDPNQITPVDCLAPGLLSVYVRGKTVRELFRPTGPGSRLLAAMQAVLDNTDYAADFLDLNLSTSAVWKLVDAAVYASKHVSGFKGVAVTKTLHRKRPNLVPILDGLVYEFYLGEHLPDGPYGVAPRRFWPVLQRELVANRGWLGRVAAGRETPDHRQLSLLRAADIIVWAHAKTKCAVLRAVSTGEGARGA